jgi:hypothetical protein
MPKIEESRVCGCADAVFDVLCKSKSRRARPLTIEIQKPELEALILERMQKGAFLNFEHAWMQALESSPLPSEPSA